MFTYIFKHIEIPLLPRGVKELINNNLEGLLLLFLLTVYCLGALYVHHIDHLAGTVDQGIWLVILLALITFLLVAALVWWLLDRYWVRLDLPPFSSMVLQFNTLELWQQLAFYYASFVSLLAAASVCLMAIC